MTIQPYDVRVQFGKPTRPSAFPKATEEEYLAKLKAKYGDDALSRLHLIENKAARRNLDRLPGESASPSVEATYLRRQGWAEAIAHASPITRHVAAAMWDVTPPAADSRLQSLEAGGFAVRVPGAKPVHWEIITGGGA